MSATTIPYCFPKRQWRILRVPGSLYQYYSSSAFLPAFHENPKVYLSNVLKYQPLKQAWDKIVKPMTFSRIQKALQCNFSMVKNAKTFIRDNVLGYGEKLVRKWIGPFIVVDVDGKTIILEIDEVHRQSSIDKVCRYTTEPSKINCLKSKETRKAGTARRVQLYWKSWYWTWNQPPIFYKK